MSVRLAEKEDFKGVHDIFLEVHNFHKENTDNIFLDVDPITKEEFKEILDNPENILLVSDND